MGGQGVALVQILHQAFQTSHYRGGIPDVACEDAGSVLVALSPVSGSPSLAQSPPIEAPLQFPQRKEEGERLYIFGGAMCVCSSVLQVTTRTHVHTRMCTHTHTHKVCGK